LHALAQSYLQSKLQFINVFVLRLKQVGDMERRMTRQEKGMRGSDREFGETDRAGGVVTDQGKESKKASQPQDTARKSGSNKLCN